MSPPAAEDAATPPLPTSAAANADAQVPDAAPRTAARVYQVPTETAETNDTELHRKGGGYVNWVQLTRSTVTPPPLPPVIPTPPPPHGVGTSPQAGNATPVQPLWHRGGLDSYDAAPDAAPNCREGSRGVGAMQTGRAATRAAEGAIQPPAAEGATTRATWGTPPPAAEGAITRATWGAPPPAAEDAITRATWGAPPPAAEDATTHAT
ncbi:nascent polypeptide-associated complex subunit alpha, muscle-specific form-like [Bacillus rossius redtenbacheri]|uniref:nascent polypeptide-associated complex subunit alpha, muscle-specific form-like n=1 Tax=Bacillus rossius redtenbacheri TaxID=93214 RepID=UPI002FDEF3B1